MLNLIASLIQDALNRLSYIQFLLEEISTGLFGAPGDRAATQELIALADRTEFIAGDAQALAVILKATVEKPKENIENANRSRRDPARQRRA